jgi:hypothetical protein
MKYIIIPALLILGGCATVQPNLIRTKHQVVVPDASMYNCPTIKSFPKVNTLTDIQVAQTMVKLYENNLTCAASMAAVQQYLAKAKADIEK